jgi:glycosyltransferase involved in cell wall biosynthesis
MPRPLRIAIDAGFVDPGRVGGAEQMLVTLVRGLVEASQPDDRIDVFTDHPWDAPAAVRFRELRGRGNRFARVALTLPSLLGDYDAVLFSNYFTPPVPRTTRRPLFVTVIHDLQYLHLPGYFHRRKRAWLRLAHEVTLRVSDRVVAISEDVRRDILSHYGQRFVERVRMVHNPVDWGRFESPDGGAPAPVDQRYILSVAAQYPHKNLETVIRAFADLRGRGGYADLGLVLVGQHSRGLHNSPYSVPLDQLVERLGLRDAVHFVGYVDDRTLAAAYRHAAVFAFPSLFEGFALPPVEALGLGLPVVTSRCGAIPETTLGLAAYLDDPLDDRELADRLSRVIDDPEAFRPSADDVARIRTAYAPARIGAAYRGLLAGDQAG